MKWSKASSWTGFNSRILETTIQRKLYCTSKARSNSLPSFAFFFFLKFLRTQKPVFRGSWGAFQRFGRWEFLLDHYHSERSGTKFEHQSATEFTICTRGSEMRNCHVQRVFSRSSRSQLRRSIFAASNRKKKPLAPRVTKRWQDLPTVRSPTRIPCMRMCGVIGSREHRGKTHCAWAQILTSGQLFISGLVNKAIA